MPRPIQKDSLSRCEHPSMLYDVVRNPNALYKAHVAPPKLPKDVLETRQQKLNREMLEKIQLNATRFPHQTYVVVVQVSKYVFMAIMLPPYILLFGLPKWLFKAVLPQVIDLVKTEFSKVGRFFRLSSKRITDMMKGALKQTIGDALKMMREKGRMLLAALKPKRVERNPRLNALMLKIRAKAAEMKKEFNVHFDRANHRLEKFANFIRKPIRSGLDKASASLKKGLNQAKKKVTEPLTAWLRPKVHEMGKVLKSLREKVKINVESVTKRLNKRLIAPLQKANEKVAEKVKDVPAIFAPIIQQVTQPVVNLMVPFWNQYVALARKRVERISALTDGRLKKVKRKLTEAVNQVSDALKRSFDAFQKQTVPFLKRLKFLKKRQWKRPEWFVTKEQVIKFLKRFSFASLKTLLAKATQTLMSARDFLIKKMSQGRKAISQFIAQLFSKMKKGKMAVTNFLRQTGEAFRISLAFFIALFTYSFTLARELTVEVASWIIPQKS